MNRLHHVEAVVRIVQRGRRDNVFCVARKKLHRKETRLWRARVARCAELAAKLSWVNFVERLVMHIVDAICPSCRCN